MRFEAFSFGAIRIDGVTPEYDVVIDRGRVRNQRRNERHVKAASPKARAV